MDMAMYRSYDPAIGRWWQIDPLAALAPEQTPYRFGFNSPMNFTDPWGLFETRREAREYKEENDVEGRVKKQKDGSFAIVNKKEKYSITKDKQYGVSFQKLGKAPKDDQPKFDENVHPTPVPDWLNGIYTSWPAEGEGYVWYDKEHNVVPYDPPVNVAHWLGRMFDGFGMLSGGSKVVGAITGAIKKGGAKNAVRNAHLAGKTHPTTNVPFNDDGFPDFSDHLFKDANGVEIDIMITPTGKRGSDFTAANEAAGFKSTPKGYTWHHHQTRGRMQLVKTAIHSKTGHTGGFSLW
jgi:hypothetical protein